MKTRHWAMFAVGGILVCLGATRAHAQETAKREAIETQFQRDLVKIEVAKIGQLGDLAASQPIATAAQTYDDLFRFAIGASQYEAAEPFALKAIATEGAPTETLLLAHMVNVVAKANRGAFTESLDSLKKAINEGRELRKGANGANSQRAMPLPARISLLNVYVQRLIHARRYDIAKQALILVRDSTKEPQIKELAASRLLQLEMVGKAAPAIVGTDLDGKPLNLDQYKGQVVLVLFWASWCPPNVGEAQHFTEILKKYEAKGFRIIGINVDSKQEGASATSVMPAVRRFVVENNVLWPNLINDAGPKDYANAYAVSQLPSDVLIDRDGKIIHIDLDTASLERTLATLMAK